MAGSPSFPLCGTLLLLKIATCPRNFILAQLHTLPLLREKSQACGGVVRSFRFKQKKPTLVNLKNELEETTKVTTIKNNHHHHSNLLLRVYYVPVTVLNTVGVLTVLILKLYKLALLLLLLLFFQVY